jgi:hypothetical protein
MEAPPKKEESRRARADEDESSGTYLKTSLIIYFI